MNLLYKIKLKGFHNNQLNKTAWLFLLWAKKEYSSLKYEKVMYPSKNTKNITVVKSPDVNKSAREQFKIDFKNLILSFHLNLNETKYSKVLSYIDMTNKEQLIIYFPTQGLYISKKLKTQF